jgi:hypothetical protein
MQHEASARAGSASEIFKAAKPYLRSVSQLQHRDVASWPDGVRNAGWRYHPEYGSLALWVARRTYHNTEVAIAALDLESRAYGDDEVAVIQCAIEKFFEFRPSLRHIRIALCGWEYAA